MTQLAAPWRDDPAAQRICAMLTDAGHQAWFVGGCVRNVLLGAPVSDLDLTTDARPEKVLALAKTVGLKAVPTGIDHGTVTVIAGSTPVEITTFRRDVATDGRHATVSFATTIAEDARRRDFTMNALYADADGQIADPLGGLPDLQARRVRFIGDPQARIREDYLRILRFFRFHAWYGDPQNGLDADGLAACAAHIDGLARLSAERVTAELVKLLSAPDPAPAFAGFAATGGLAQVLPGAAAGALAVLVHLEQGAGLPPDPVRRLAVTGGDATARLRLSKAQTTRLAQINSGLPPLEAAYRHGAQPALDSALVAAALAGQPLDPALPDRIADAAAQTCPVTAADLMPDLQGPALGDALRRAEARWIASGFTLTKAELLG